MCDDPRDTPQNIVRGVSRVRAERDLPPAPEDLLPLGPDDAKAALAAAGAQGLDAPGFDERMQDAWRARVRAAYEISHRRANVAEARELGVDVSLTECYPKSREKLPVDELRAQANRVAAGEVTVPAGLVEILLGGWVDWDAALPALRAVVGNRPTRQSQRGPKIRGLAQGGAARVLLAALGELCRVETQPVVRVPRPGPAGGETGLAGGATDPGYARTLDSEALVDLMIEAGHADIDLVE